MSNDRGDNEWKDFHLEKSISVGHILTTVTFLLAVLWWGAGLDKRVDLNTNAIQTNRELIVAESVQTDRELDGLSATLIRIENKLDRAIEQ